jgi:predicted transcriptional regulator
MTAAQVLDALGGDLAYNTVQTILIRLHDKEVLRRERPGRSHVYWPVDDAATTAAAKMRAALGDRADRRAVLRHFAASLDDDEVAELRQMLTITRRRRRS